MQRNRRRIGAALLLGLACLVVYNANLRRISAADTLPARYLPLAVWHHRTVELDPVARWVAHGHSTVAPWQRPRVDGPPVAWFEPWAYWLVRTHDGHLASLYPIAVPLLVSPLYLPAVFYLRAHGWAQPEVDHVAEGMEKLSASLLATLASVLMWLVLRRDAGRWGLALALAFAFGCNTWMISSQALWQHGGGELWLALALLLTSVSGTPTRGAALGFACALAAACRPPDALLAGAIGLVALWRRRELTRWIVLGAVGPVVALLVYNVALFRNLVGGYGAVETHGLFWRSGWAAGVAGLLVSPARGLLVFSPFLIFVPVGLRQRLRDPATRALALALALAVLALFLVYARGDWRAGTSWGPRWLTDMLPVLVWMLAPAPLVLRPLARGLLVVTIAASIAVQAIGAFWYTKASDAAVASNDPVPMAGAWRLANVPFLVELRHPPARGELQCTAMGSLDRIGDTLRPPIDGPPSTVAAGAALEGWALACNRTPATVLVLVEGIVVGSTTQFLPRPDVEAAMNTRAAAGWRLLADLRGVPTGERVLQLAVRIHPTSDVRIVREYRVRVLPRAAPQLTVPSRDAAAAPAAASLASLAARAAAHLRADQSAAGYWLTQFTGTTSYTAPHPEMNTFLTATLVDLLAPLASADGLADVVERGRRHLAAQIEPDGLVRYHGRPDGPTIGTLGCVITPDADDTALAWRIAAPPAADPRRAPMRRTLDAYRDARGLYRTWLAPRAGFQCLDPGKDPDPADVAIQMHVLLLLEATDRPAAAQLCRALTGAIDDDQVWVYYARAPLIPFLRAAELAREGCVLPFPRQRLATAVAGQQDWYDIAQRLVAASSGDASATHAARVDGLLARLAADDFAAVRREPPLLYHNDLTATVSRYYWSPDVGYALWLRLYAAHRAAVGGAR